MPQEPLWQADKICSATLLLAEPLVRINPNTACLGLRLTFSKQEHEIALSLPFHVAKSHAGCIVTHLKLHVTARFAGSDVQRINLFMLQNLIANFWKLRNLTLVSKCITAHCLPHLERCYF